jgi:hypothetical protein
VIDSQSVKTTESGGPRRYAAEKMIKGRKQHILTDAIGLPVAMVVGLIACDDLDFPTKSDHWRYRGDSSQTLRLVS